MAGEWHPDPTGRHQYRWWDGQEWTDQVIRDASGQIVELQSVGRDVTERKQAEEALRESEAIYRQAIEVAGAVPYRRIGSAKICAGVRRESRLVHRARCPVAPIGSSLLSNPDWSRASGCLRRWASERVCAVRGARPSGSVSVRGARYVL